MEEYWKGTVHNTQNGITALFMVVRRVSEEHVKMMVVKETELLPNEQASIVSLQFGDLPDTRILGSINANLHVRPDVVREGIEWVDPTTITTQYQKKEQSQMQQEVNALNPKVTANKNKRSSPSPKKQKLSSSHFFQSSNKDTLKGLSMSDDEMDKAMDAASTAMEDNTLPHEVDINNSPPANPITTANNSEIKAAPSKKQGNLLNFFKSRTLK